MINVRTGRDTDSALTARNYKTSGFDQLLKTVIGGGGPSQKSGPPLHCAHILVRSLAWASLPKVS